ncbi:DinB family protein [Nocardiopsis algeriensis]|uniref:Putative damage-inducible protein DinB n=1 Tax=Nocardiopsis algeriensis TaxID=1478215 RepID=A0A841II98_9ACTN|nr:DinB family protein [Nocardiopsis algeriensis]MBB6118489.1 putative damage-inducible protein DinB [Nocardiopsis algeriensis]
MSTGQSTVDAERECLLRILGEQRGFLRFTVQGLTDEQARSRPTVSELSLGGLVKHVAKVERDWMSFVLEGAEGSPVAGDDDKEHAGSFHLADGETLASVLEDYAKAAEETDRTVRSLPDLEVSHLLPPAPWFPEGTSWTARDVLVHLVRETAQHCGHADILRETLDGQRTMG